MSNAIIITVLLIILFAAVKGSLKHFKGEGGCCGGGGSVVEEPDKKLDGPVIKTSIYKIEGMTCVNCTNRVKRAINRIDGASASLNLRKKQAVVQFDKDIDDSILISEIEKLGYKVTHH
ncbi:MAG: heavy-metal-associated domain-containing protein [Butyrivibrio sp.]|nr:heavy-metal-associated domain-containing protein [Butyrivibrio sp.]